MASLQSFELPLINQSIENDEIPSLTDEQQHLRANLIPLPDIPSFHLHHHGDSLSSKDYRQISKFETLNYVENTNRFFRVTAQRNIKDSSYRKRRFASKWIFAAVTGIITALVAFSITISIENLIEWKFETIHEIIHHGTIKHDNTSQMDLPDSQLPLYQQRLKTKDGTFFSAYLVFILISCIFGFLATIGIHTIGPSAAGSGIPDVIAYLNGVRIPKALNIKTFLVKVFSVIFSVASGLICGPEGPSIHSGAIIGAGISQMKSNTLNINENVKDGWTSIFRNDRDKRDYITIGSACGVASAFKSPVGGCLFSLEELPIRIHNSLMWRTLFSCMCATFVVVSLKSASGENRQAQLTADETQTFALDSAPGTTRSASFYIFEVFLFILVGILGGVFGAIFTKVSLFIFRFRLHLYDPTTLESTHDSSSSSSTSSSHRIFNETYSHSILFKKIHSFIHKSKTSAKIFKISEVVALVFLTATISFLLSLSFQCTLIPAEIIARAEEHSKISGEEILMDFIRFGCPQRYYNEFATLSFNDPDTSVGHLLTQGFPSIFGFTTLCIGFIFFFFFSSIIAGMGISAGLVIPLLLVGGTYGRLVGLFVHALFEPANPGLYSLIGMAGFIGGVSRLMLSFSVILLEITGQLSALLPIMFSMVSGKFIADKLQHHTLYHGILSARNVPFLDSEVPKITKILAAQHVMTPKPVCLPERVLVKDILHILQTTRHNAFPVVQKRLAGGNLINNDFRFTPNSLQSESSTQYDDALRGIILRRSLLILLHYRVFVNRSTDLFLQSNSSGKDMSVVELLDTQYAQRLAQTTLRTPKISDLQLSEQDLAKYIDLEPFMNRSPHICETTGNLYTVYQQFQRLGLRHIIVLDDHHSVVGIITRKDLLESSLKSAASGSRFDWDIVS